MLNSYAVKGRSSSAMSGQIKIKRHKDYFLVHVKGDPLSPHEIESALSKVVAQAIESHLSIIIQREMPVKQRASTIDFYLYAKSLRRSEFRGKLALAFPKEMHHDNLDFFEATARNRGINLTLFSTMEEAVNWITGHEGPPRFIS